MNELSQIDNDQLKQLLQDGHSPEEAAKILLESRQMVHDACQRLLNLPTEALQKMLDELDAQEATDDNEKR